MTSLDVDVSPSGDKTSNVLGRVNNCSTPCDKSSVGTVSIHNHLSVQDHTSVGAGCSCDHSSVDVPGILSAGGLNDIPGETVSE